MKKSAQKFDGGTKYQAEPEVLELRGDSVEYQVTLNIDPKKLDPIVTVDINPTLVYGDSMMARPQVTVQGEKAKGSKAKGTNTITSKDGGKVTFKDKFKYQPEMKNSQLKAMPNVMIKGYDPVQDQCYPSDTVVIASGIVTTHELGEDGENILESGDAYEPIYRDVNVELYYLINSSSFNPYFKVKSAGIDNKEQLKELKNLGNDTVYQIKGITIYGKASPDGELKINEDLSKKRAENTFKYLTKQLKKLGFDEVHDSAFALNFTMTEDWDGWKMMVANSDLSDKDQILAIMNSNMPNDAKEAEIKAKHAKSYAKMKEDMLPKLRRATIAFNRQQPLKTDEELLTYRNNMKDLEVVELLQLARIVEGAENQLAVYEEVKNRDANDWRAYNNMGYVYLTNGDAEKALPMLEKANSLNPKNAIVLNNLGVANAMMKNYTASADYYKQAKEAGMNVDNNVGMLEYRQGHYQTAVDNLTGDNLCQFNTALSFVMKGDYSKAKEVLECIKTEERDARYYYLYAVLGARTNNLEMATSNLTRSIQMDATMRDRAKNDLEFRRIKDRAEFSNAIR
ncbi:MAG: tetratricopeptide repeat protein [Bacteroidota bacterium]|nr:tetratricopeptide repeat protein [Bacteroidota bacterium]MDX5429452.1 tetratricopeptide repeat protein [Bacteroidota bacterium]MDX5468244.1 tetratricopeptide repeat protein [Bacteroidota bacterium]